MKSKAKILFVLPAFRYGGTMTSFENLLMLIANEDIEVDVYAIVDEGDARDKVAKYSRILNNSSKREKEKNNSFRSFAKWGKDLVAKLGIDLGKILIKRRARRFDCSKYEVVIGYQEGYATEFVAYSNAIRKIAWVHSMYSRWCNSKTSAVYDMIDTIVCVSETAKEDMLSVYPNGNGRISVVYNSLNKDKVIELSNEYAPSLLNDRFRIISVGRIDPVKRFSEVPIIANKIKEKGLKFRWTIVGGAAVKKEYYKLTKRIEQLGLKNELVLKGQLENPYPEIKNSNLLVCLSSSETFNYTLTEARILGVPVVTSDFPAAKEFVINGVDGTITSLENIDNVIISLISNEEMYNQQKNNLGGYTYNNIKILNSFRQLVFCK